MPLQHLLHPSSSPRDGIVQLHLDRLEPGSQALLHRLAPMTKEPRLRDRVQKCVKPRKSKVSGFPSPRVERDVAGECVLPSCE